ncbi:MAG: hypothetical protein R2878_00355 [Thermoleophilia bacterium]
MDWEPFADEALAAFIRGLAAGPPMSASGDVDELRRAGVRGGRRPVRR